MENTTTGNSTPDPRWGEDGCKLTVPSLTMFFQIMAPTDVVLVTLYTIGAIIVLIVFVEEVIFLRKHFALASAERRRRTTWLLALFPSYAVTSVVGTIIPRSSVIVNLTSSAFFGSCLFQLLELMLLYMGGRKRLWHVIGENKMVSPRTLPLCCCLRCLQDFKITREKFRRYAVMVLQVSFIRPGLMFIAACLWADGSYESDDPIDSFLVITILNLCSTMPAMYGLNQLREVVSPHLDPVSINGKVMLVQCTMICTLAYDVLMTILDAVQVVDCTRVFPASARAYTIYHGLTIGTMVIFSILGRKLFRVPADGTFVVPLAGERLGRSVSMTPSEFGDMEGYSGSQVILYPAQNGTQKPHHLNQPSSRNKEEEALGDAHL